VRALCASLVLIALAACDGADARYEKSFKLAYSGAEKCRVARDAQRHFLEAGDAEKLEKWRSKGAYECLSATGGRF
jgi:hypothetical protein